MSKSVHSDMGSVRSRMASGHSDIASGHSDRVSAHSDRASARSRMAGLHSDIGLVRSDVAAAHSDRESAHADTALALLRTQRKIERWRQQRRPRARIPEELWREAAELACAYGINQTAKILRLDYYSLKKRLPAAARLGRHEAEFVEILPGGIPSARPQCTIEVEETTGAKMRIHLQGGEMPDVAAILGAFRRSRS